MKRRVIALIFVSTLAVTSYGAFALGYRAAIAKTTGSTQ